MKKKECGLDVQTGLKMNTVKSQVPVDVIYSND